MIRRALLLWLMSSALAAEPVAPVIMVPQVDVEANVRHQLGARVQTSSEAVHKTGTDVSSQGDAPVTVQPIAMPASLALPEVNVEVSVRRLLEAARVNELTIPASEGASSDVTGEVASSPVPPPPLQIQPPVAAPEESVTIGHVPLPAKTVTIRDMGDIGALNSELEAATRRARESQ